MARMKMESSLDWEANKVIAYNSFKFRHKFIHLFTFATHEFKSSASEKNPTEIH